MFKRLLQNSDVRSGVTNGVIVVVFAFCILVLALLAGGSQVQMNIAYLPSMIAVMVSGYVFKRRHKFMIGVSLNHASNNVLLHALGMATVFVPVLTLTGYFNDIFASNEFGALAKVFIFMVALAGVWMNTFMLMLFGGFFYRIKYAPSPVEERLTTIATFSDAIQAQIAKDFLEINEVPAYLQNQFAANLWQGSAIRIELQVPFGFMEEAGELLAAMEEGS